MVVKPSKRRYDGSNKIKRDMAKRVDGEDRISELPVHIIHQILYRTNLDVEEAARTCILSKRWYYCWSSRPILIFCQLQGNTYIPLKKFVKLIDQSLRFHVEHNLHLEKFFLTYQDPELASHLDRWTELALKVNVTVLGIRASDCSWMYYSLPDAKKLTALWLSRCKFEFDICTTHVRFCCLEDLCLYDVHISDAQLQRFSDICPSIRNLKLLACRGISKLHVFGLVHLEDLTAHFCKLDSVIVQAPNLQSFKYAERNVHPCEIAILDGYNTLQKLKLSGASITDQQFRDVSYKFPDISELNLTRCYKLKNIEIQSEKLTKFTISELNSLEKVTIQAPNLLEFDFEGDKIPFSSMDPSSLERARLNFFLPRRNFGYVDSSWYTNLHHFVQKFNYSKGLILVIFCRKTNNILIYENPREILIPPSHNTKIFIAPILHIESIIGTLMFNCPRIMSILPCTNSNVHQVLSVLKGCTQKQNCCYKCPFNTQFFHKHRKLKEVISCTGISEEGITSIWYSWLKSTSLIDQLTNFVFKW